MSEIITSLQNQRVKNAVKLRDRRGREKQNCIIIDGAREILRAIEAGVRLIELFVCHEQIESDESRTVLASAQDAGAELLEVSPRVFEKVAFGQRSEGVVAVAKTPTPRFADLPSVDHPLIAVLDGIEKPGNLGAVIRSADGAGISALILADGRTDLFNPGAIRASLGTVFSLPVCEASGEESRNWLIEQNITIVAADVDGELDYDQYDFTQATAIVLGSEADGLSRVWRDEALVRIRLPMRGAADSLNVSATAAVLFYESVRQRCANS